MIRLPASICDHLPSGEIVIDVKLKDGRVVRDLLVNEKRFIEGKIVGGQTGVTDDVGFSEDDILAVRHLAGFLAYLLHRMKWIPRT
jgi:hypothetical protein